MTLRRVFLPMLGVLALVALACTPPGGGGTTTTTLSGAPVAVASASPTIGDAPLTVFFDSAGSTPGTGTGLTYTWDFGDGSPTESGPTASHMYGTVGSYTATLTMASTEGSSTSPGIAITVNLDPNPKYYVKTTGSSGAACGPIADPCSTIVEAQANAVANGIHTIRVAGGSFSQPLSLVSDMDVTGGWKQDFSDFGASEVTTIFGTGTQPAVTINGVSNSSISGVSAQGIARTSGDATGILVTGGSTGVKIGDIDSPQTLIAGGTGPNATGVLVTGGSSVTVENANINSGTTTGAGASAYGLRALGLSVVNVVLSEITGQPGVPGVSASGGTPAQAGSGTGGGRGGDSAGARGAAGGGAYSGGQGGKGGGFYAAGENGANGAGPAAGAGGAGGCGSAFGCGGDAGGGHAGGGGAAGAAGTAGSNTPVAGDLWVSTNGQPGTSGAPGSGGGGGGGGKSASGYGGSGGGGGGGGYGGAAGTIAGTSGGGSFGVYANSASVNLSSSTATSSAGGSGGSGANAGRGGNGGNGGDGGNKSCCESAGGGGGGGGAAGGGGGGAGGGAGGPSIAVYHIGVGSLTLTASSQFRPVFPASGGSGGAFAAPATGGLGGFRGNCANIGGCANGADGYSAGTGNLGPAGQSGPAGQLFRVWDNGTTTS